MSADPYREPQFEQALPNNPEAERAVLGAVLLDNNLIDQAILLTTPDYYYTPSHRHIFCAMIELRENASGINPALIGGILKRDRRLESVGGISFITDLTYGLPHSSSIKHYAAALKALYMSRWTVKEASRIISAAQEQDEPIERLIDTVIEKFAAKKEELAVKAQSGGSIKEIAEQVIDYLYTVKAGINPAIPTAFATLNQLTGGGIQQGEMRGTAALSSRGKTSMLLQDFRYSAKENNHVCILFSLEMKTLLIALRCLGAETGVPINRIRPGMPDAQIDYLVDQVQKTFTYPLWIYTDCRSVQDIHTRIRWFKRQYPHLELKRVGIDYYGKISGYGRGRDRYENRTQELKYIADYLQQEIAIGENVALDVPSQFNRSAWSLKDPGPANIDGGEAYYQACDLFAVLQTETEKGKPGVAMVPATLAVHKQRNGPTAVGKEKLKYVFHREKMEFYPALEDEGDVDEAPVTTEESNYL